MSLNAPAQQRDRSAPYSQTFTTAQASLTNKVASAGPPPVQPYLNAPSGMLVIVTAASPVFAWTDCAGTVNTITFGATTPVGSAFWLPLAALSLATVTNCTVVVYWHGTGSY